MNVAETPVWRQPPAILAFIVVALLASFPFVAPWHNPPWFTYYPEWLTAVGAVMLAGVLLHGPRSQRLTPTTWWFGLFALAVVVQTAILQPGYWMPGLTAALQLAVCAVLAQCVALARARWGTDRLLLALCAGLVAGGFLSGLVSWTQRLDITSSFPGLVLVHPVDPRQALGNIGQRNLYGHYMMWASMAAVYLFARLPRFRLALFVLLSWMAFEAALAESRTLLGYYAGWLIIALAGLFWRRGEVQRRFSLASLWAIGVGVVMQFIGPDIVSALASAAGEPIQARAGIDRFADQGAGLGRRVAEWEKAWITFRDHPLLGVGWGYFAGASFQLHTLPQFAHFREDVLWTHCHNSVLQIMAEMGLLGVLFLLGLAGLLLRGIKQWQSGVTVLALPLLGVSLLHSQMEYPLWYLHYLGLFAVYLALLEPPVTTRPQAADPGWRAPVFVVLVAATAVHPWLYEWSVGGLQGSVMQRTRGERLQDLHSLSRIPAFDYLAENNLARLALHDPRGWAPYDQVTARLMQFRPFPDASYWRMCALGSTGHADQIEALFRHAQQAYPGYAYGFARDLVRYECVPPSLDPWQWLDPKNRPDAQP